MLAPFVTLAFLAALWLVAAIGAELVLSSGRRILAVLRREAPAIDPRMIVRARPARPASARTRPMRAQPQLRAAA
jgi:hypothetical protein